MANTVPSVPRYRWWLFPNPPRFRPHWYDWYRLFLTVVILAVVVPGIYWLWPRIPCRPGPFGLPANDVWSQGGECVGLTSTSYGFGQDGFHGVLQKVADQNGAAKESCAEHTNPVTVGVLVTLNSPEVGGRAQHLLEGIAAAQANANSSKTAASCVHPIRLRVAQMGATEQASTGVARLLANDQQVAAVVGLGLSEQRTADAVRVLAARRIPMVSSVISAEGFDRNGSMDDKPVFSDCDPQGTYRNGIGQGFFYRMAYRNAMQVSRLAEYFTKNGQNNFNFILTPNTIDDPYTCTTLPLLHQSFANVQEVRFDPTDPVTVSQSAKRICASHGTVKVLYSARAHDLATFLKGISDEFANGQCPISSLTVASTSDAARMRSREPDPNLEQQREAALHAKVFQDGTIRLVYTPLADPGLTDVTAPGLKGLRQALAALGFQLADLDDGWAVEGYDSLLTVATAVNEISAHQKVTPSRVNTGIGGFDQGGEPVFGAGGKITFDDNGNRNDSKPVVVQFCPPRSTGQDPSTVEVYPTAGECP